VLAFWKVWSRCSTSTANRGPVHAGRFDSSAFRCPWNGDLRRDYEAVALAVSRPSRGHEAPALASVGRDHDVATMRPSRRCRRIATVAGTRPPRGRAVIVTRDYEAVALAVVGGAPGEGFEPP
jgi:hypothetical protein